MAETGLAVMQLLLPLFAVVAMGASTGSTPRLEADRRAA